MSLSENKTVPRFLIIGKPGSIRARLFTDTLERRGFRYYTVIDYLDLLPGCTIPEHYLTSETVIRLDAPGQNFPLTQALTSMGFNETPRIFRRIPPKHAMNLKEERGRIDYPWQWFAGYRTLLTLLKENTDEFFRYRFGRPAHFMNDPLEIITQFNKPDCQKLLSDNGILVPEIVGTFSSAEEFRDKNRKRNIHQLILKLPASSSASGIALYQQNNHQESLTTTLELRRKGRQIRFYDSRKIRTYTDATDITGILHWYAKENVHTEEWIDKMITGDESFDLRLLTVNGRIVCTVGRASRSPFTNLHLGGRRFIPDADLKKQLPWDVIEGICRKVGELFPNSLYSGIDLGIDTSGNPFVFEVNAFGDHLNDTGDGLTSHYDAELDGILDRLAGRSAVYV